MGLSIPEVALISGHRDYRMLARYTHLRPEHLLSKISLGNPVDGKIIDQSPGETRGTEKIQNCKVRSGEL